MGATLRGCFPSAYKPNFASLRADLRYCATSTVSASAGILFRMFPNNAIDGRVYLADSRHMGEISDESVALIITSPPYWHIKDYSVPHQIGYGQTLHEYLYDLARVWKECWRVLMPGRRLCINIGDQFARAILYRHYKVIPLHAEIIAQCETIGFDYLGAIIWQKKTPMRPSGGAVVMGSFPYPPNGIVELDYEYILIFRKPGKSAPVDPQDRALSALTRQVIRREHNMPPVDPPEGYIPRIKDAKPLVDPALVCVGSDVTYRVVQFSRADDGTPLLIMDNGLRVRLLGVRVRGEQSEALERYVRTYLLGKRVILRFEQPPAGDSQPIPVYLYLTNRLFINRKIIEMRLAEADRTSAYRLKDRFLQAEKERNGF